MRAAKRPTACGRQEGLTARDVGTTREADGAQRGDSDGVRLGRDKQVAPHVEEYGNLVLESQPGGGLEEAGISRLTSVTLE